MARVLIRAIAISIITLSAVFLTCSNVKNYNCEMEVFYYVYEGFLPYPYECNVCQRVNVAEVEPDQIWKTVFLIYRRHGNELLFERCSREIPQNKDIYAKGYIFGWRDSPNPTGSFPFQMLVAFDFNPLKVWSNRLDDELHREENKIKLVTLNAHIEKSMVTGADVLSVRSIPGRPIRRK